MEYLENYNFTIGEISKLKKRFNKDINSKFELMQYNVTLILDYLSSLDIVDFHKLIMNRPDVCFMNIDILKEKLSKFDTHLIKFIFENEVDNLMNFDI